MEIITEYDFEVIYKAGAKNVHAKALSWISKIDTVSKSEISSDIKERIWEEMHVCPIGGHQGINRTYGRLKLYINWDNIFNYTKNCIVCAKLKGNVSRPVLQELTFLQRHGIKSHWI